MGGPIFKNRTFFFADYEGIRQSKGITTVTFVPSESARKGMLSTGNVTVDPAAGAFLTWWRGRHYDGSGPRMFRPTALALRKI